MRIEKAKLEDLPEILAIYQSAREFMKSTGNSMQWVNYPQTELLRQDIAEEKLFVCKEAEEIVAVFYYEINDDETYREIDGTWLNEEKYGVVHRIAVKEGKRGVGTFCLMYAYEDCKNLKIDTHADNLPMRNLLKKLGFEYCGIITLQNGDKRWAYQKETSINGGKNAETDKINRKI